MRKKKTNRGLETPFTFVLDGFDTFEKVQTTIRENDTAEFELFFPKITFILEWDLNDDFIAVKGTQMSIFFENLSKFVFY